MVRQASAAALLAQSKLDDAKQKVELTVASSGVDVQRLTENARASALALKARMPSTLKRAEGSQSTDALDASDDESEVSTEKGRLVKDKTDHEIESEESDVEPGMARGGSSMLGQISAFGSRLSQIGNSGRASLGQSLDGARNMGVGSLRNVAAAGSHIRSSGAEKLAAAKDKAQDKATAAKEKAVAAKKKAVAAKDRAKDKLAATKEALGAATELSGISLGRPGKTQNDKTRVCPCCPALTLKQRIAGTVICLVLGSLLSLFSLSSLAKLILGNPTPFAFKYTLGNLLSLGAASFMVGPAKQCRDMAAPSRRTASLVYLATLAGTLTSVFYFKLALLSLCFIVLQFLALTWYTLSYIPFGHTAAKKLLRRVLKKAGFASASHTTSSMSSADEVA